VSPRKLKKKANRKAAGSLETSVQTYQTTRRLFPEDDNAHPVDTTDTHGHKFYYSAVYRFARVGE
jgi:hypothetical protein